MLAKSKIQSMIFVVVFAGFAWGQSSDYGLTLGYRDIDLAGNSDVYRTQVNEDSGLDLQSFWFNMMDPEDQNHFFDRLRLDVSGFGSSPGGRIDFELRDVSHYKVSLTYQRFAYFSSLPGYANPLENQGIYPGQHRLDKHNQVLDFKLELLPSGMIRPIVGLSWREYKGPSQTTFTVGGDEFRLDSHNNEKEKELFVGLDFSLGQWEGELVTGKRTFRGRELYQLSTDAGAGNNPGRLFGQEITLEELLREDLVKGDTPATRFHLAGPLHEKVRLLAAYAYADGETDSSSDESLAGNLVSFRARRIFGAESESVQAKTQHPSWQGQARVVADPTDQISIQSTLSRNHRELDGFAMIDQVLMDSTTLGGSVADDLVQLVESTPTWERDDTTFSTEVSAFVLPFLGFKVEGTRSTRETVIGIDTTQIVIPGGQDGTFRRKVNRYGFGTFLRLKNLKVDADWQNEKADQVIMRTDFLQRDRYQLKADLKLFKKWHLTGQYKTADYGNDIAQIAYDGSDSQTNFGLDGNFKPINFHVGYGIYRLDSEAMIRIPTDFSYQFVTHREHGSSSELSCDWSFLKKYSIASSYNRYKNEGALPFELESYTIHAEVSFNNQLQVFLEGVSRDYREVTLPLSNYESDGVGIYLRWTR